MTRLDDYCSAMLAALPETTDEELAAALDEGGPVFSHFVIDHGLGPLWHERTEREEFHASRLSAEALYLAQEHALTEIDTVLDKADIDYALIKGAATRLLLHENPAIRACYDLDLLVRSDDRVRAASVLVEAGYKTAIDFLIISHELVLSRGVVDIDLHWGLLREGRLSRDPVADMLDRRRQERDTWMLSREDALFVLLVHPAFAKHLSSWEMGLHRVADIVTWLRTQSFDWEVVRTRLEQAGVRTAAWATLRWVKMLTPPNSVPELDTMLQDLRPGYLRRAWLEHWLRNNLSSRMSSTRWPRLLGFLLFLHDSPGDAARALVGRRRAHRNSSADVAAFQELLDQ